MKMKVSIASLFVCVFVSGLIQAQNEENLRLIDWQPKSQMVVKETKVVTPKFPVIDIHNHLGNFRDVQSMLEAMDEAGVWMCINLDARSANDAFKQTVETAKAASQERLKVFMTPDFSKIDEPDFGKKEAAKLEQAVKMGVRGLKIFKSLGLTFKDKSGKLIPVDDPRIDPIWAKCGELGIPVMIHISDPKAFHAGPIDRYNERYDELVGNPSWSFYGDQFPTKEELLAQRNRMIARHPNTIFIGAHVADLAEDLGRVSLWLDQYPNYYVDISARISELGRQPYTARKFMIKYQDRILFGSDTRPNVESYRVYYRFLETDDEYFDPTPAHKLQGRWMIYGVYLPDEALEKIYYKNALKIMSMFNKL
jgi:predicted TIM-barrel fold metal-dependent hydrolase